MAGDGQGRKTSKVISRHRRDSIDSSIQMNETFFEESQIYTQSQTWKSERAKDREQFERKKNLVKRIAPEQFRNPARPTRGPCEIVPHSYEEWVQHQSEIKQMEIEIMKRNISIKEQRINSGPDARKPLKSSFDPSNEKFQDGRAAVLSQPTVWSHLPELPIKHLIAPWPSQDELRFYGDNRENGRTRCGRFFPPPRLPGHEDIPIEERILLRSFALDEIGPLHSGGPRPSEIQQANHFLDNDDEFKETGLFLIGLSLMEEVGKWKPPFEPDWVCEQRETRATQGVIDFQHDTKEENVSWVNPVV